MWTHKQRDSYLLGVNINRLIAFFVEEIGEGLSLLRWKRKGLFFDVVEVCIREEIITENNPSTEELCEPESKRIQDETGKRRSVPASY